MLSLFKRAQPAASQIGVFATADGVAAVQVVRTPAGRPRLECCVYEPRGPNDAVARAVGRLPNKRAPVVTVLEPRGYHLLLVEAPEVPPEELRAAVRWRVKDLIDFHIDDAIIDVFEMPAPARGGRARMVYAVTAKAELVKQQVELVESAGLNLEVVDIPELCLRNVAALLDAENRGSAFLYLEERRSTLLLVRQGVLYIARHIETGVATLADADGMRRDLVAGLALEVRRSLDYFESHYEQTAIPQIFACGLEGADREQLAQDLGVAVRDVDLESVFDTSEKLGGDLQRRCLPAVGAALRRDTSTP
jgi:MSHA biogenesis protein MshI